MLDGRYIERHFNCLLSLLIRVLAKKLRFFLLINHLTRNSFIHSKQLLDLGTFLQDRSTKKSSNHLQKIDGLVLAHFYIERTLGYHHLLPLVSKKAFNPLAQTGINKEKGDPLVATL